MSQSAEVGLTKVLTIRQVVVDRVILVAGEFGEEELGQIRDSRVFVLEKAEGTNKECLADIHDLLIPERCRCSNVADVQGLSTSSDIDEARVDRYRGCVDTFRRREGSGDCHAASSSHKDLRNAESYGSGILGLWNGTKGWLNRILKKGKFRP